MSSNESTTKPVARKTGLKNMMFRCPQDQCPFFARTHDNFKAHIERQHLCLSCGLYCHSKAKHNCLTPGARLGHVDADASLDLTHFHELSRSHGGAVLMYKYNKPIETKDIAEAYSDLQTILVAFLQQLFSIHGHLKLELCLAIEMEKEIRDDEGNAAYKYATIYFKSNHYELIQAVNIPDILLRTAEDIIEKKNVFINNGSGWKVKSIQSFEIKIGEIKILKHVGGGGYLPMPLLGKKGYINFKNNNDGCFLYCVSAAIFKNEEPESSRKSFKKWEKYFGRFDMTDVNFPVRVDTDIPKFEQNNAIGINVLTHQAGEITLLRKAPKRFSQRVTLFLIQNNVSSHYVLVTHLDKFFRSKRTYARYYCDTCFNSFMTTKVRSEHQLLCGKKAIRERIPKIDQRIEFKRMELSIGYPYILYWDFETFSEPSDRAMGQSTRIKAEYKPCSYSLCLVYNDGKESTVKNFEYYDGPDPVQHFYHRVFYHAQNVLSEIRSTNNFIQPTPEELARHEAATHCAFCKSEFTTPNVDGGEAGGGGGVKKKRVIKSYHHSHQSGLYLHALCQPCNLKIKYKNELVCVAHNFSGFDSHLLVQNLESTLFDISDVNVITKGSEKIIQLEIAAKDLKIPPIRRTFNINEEKRFCGNRKVKVRFIDSCQFLPNSLAELATALKNENAGGFKMLHASLPFMFPHQSVNSDALDLLTEKLAYPYTFLSGPEVLMDGHPIPPREKFYNDLKREAPTDKEWDTVMGLIKQFNITDFRQFTRIYTMIDVILLSIVFENFRLQCMNTYKLDPSYMCTTSGYSWQCFLHFTNAKIDYVRDTKMLEMIKQGIRGGTSFCTQKINTANNERNPLGYDPNKERTHLLYVDVVSLYATAMLDKFPEGNYQWVDKDKLEQIDWTRYDGEDDTGYILKVDLGYPPALQDSTVDLPLAPEKVVVKVEELSPQQQQDIKDMNMGRSFTCAPRLLLHCGERKDYVVHYRALRYYLQMGMTLNKITSGFKFTEKAYFRDYIQFNIDQRKLAKSASQRSLLKLANNSLYGKCLQANKNNLIVKFCDTSVQARKLISSERCADFVPITETLSMIMLRPVSVKLDKPTITGFTVLDLAKVIFYTNYYQRLKLVFGNRITNLYMDTDSSINIIRDPNNTFYNDLVEYRQFFDFSKIPADHEIFKTFSHIPDLRNGNKGVSGLWALESISLAQAIFIKSKQYSLLYFDMVEEKKSKGVPMSNLKFFSHDQYKEIILEKKQQSFDINMIRSFKHKVYNLTVNKVGFHCVDIYRVYCNSADINFSLPLGHYRLDMYM